MAAASEEDEVVMEIEVFLAKALAEKLFLFHYPTRNTSFADSEMECLSARIKPKQQKLELEVALNTHSPNYDHSRGEQMAINVDGLNPSGDTYFKSSVMDKQIFTATKAGSCTDSYAVGYLRRGELHVTPLHSVVELRPSFVYMDKVDSQAKKLYAAEEEVEETEAVAVTVRFEGPNAEKDRRIREKSYQYLQQKNASEPWIDINFNPLGSDKSKREYDLLTCSQMQRDVAGGCISPKTYLKELVPEYLRLSGYKSVRDEETAYLEGHPLSDQIKHLMVNAHVLRFSKLLEKLRCFNDIVAVERLIQQFAVLVQGCWVVKSELLYEEDSVSAFTGASSKLLINARDYMVWLFTKSRCITRSEILSAIYVPDEDLKHMISQIAVKCNRVWEFKFSYDKEFVESHQSIAQSQDIKWNLRYKKLVKELSLGMSDSEGDSQKAQCSIPRQNQKRRSRSSLSEDGEESGNDSSLGNKESKSLRTYLPKKRLNVNSSKQGVKPKPYPIATLDVSPTFIEASLSDDVKSELRDYIGDALKSQFCMTFSELKELIAESDISSLVNRSDFEKLLEDAVTDCGAQKLKNKWPQNTIPKPLYAFTKFGNRLDRYRNVLIDLYSTTARSRQNLFVKRVEDELNEIISDADCRQIFDDYCVYKSGYYYLKGTVSLDS